MNRFRPSRRPPAKKSNKTAAETPPVDPLLAPGLKKTSVLLRARGSGPQLLDFLRRLERLSLLVVQSDLALTGPRQRRRGLTTELRLKFSLYARV